MKKNLLFFLIVMLTVLVSCDTFANEDTRAGREISRHAFLLIKHLDSKAASGGVGDNETASMFDRLDSLWADAREAVARSDKDKMQFVDDRVQFLHWWNRTLYWCLECDVEGKPQSQSITTRSELEDRLAAVPQRVLETLASAAGEECDAARITPAPTVSINLGCHAGMGSTAMIEIYSELR